MTRRYTGGFLSATEQVTDSNTANGVFTLAEAQEKTALGNFPVGRWTPQRSLRWRSAASAYMNRTPTVAGSQTTWTFSFWCKRSTITTNAQRVLYVGNGSNSETDLYFTSDRFQFEYYVAPTNYYVRTNRVYRDPSAWYHIVVVYDSTNASSYDRIRIYTNGIRETDLNANVQPPQNFSMQINSAANHLIGTRTGGSDYFDGYLSEVNFIDGQSLEPSYFGYTDPETGTWVPKRYTGTYGTNGFYLPFSNNGSTTALGLDMSPARNMVTYSEQLDNAAWTKGNLNVTANAVNDPLNATLTVDKVIPTSTNGYHTIYQGVTVQPSTYYTMSFYGKTAGYGRIQMGDSNTVGGGAYFDLNTGSLYGQTTSNNQSLYDQSANIESVGNGWYRCYITFKTGSSQSGINQFLYIVKDDGTTSYAGDTTSGTYLWGMQVNPGKYPNTYTLSTSSALANDWTVNNFSVTAGTTYDSMVDVPGISAVSSQTDVGGVVRGNYATLNPLYNGGYTLSEGNLYASGSSAITVATMGIPPYSGKFYWEVTAAQTTTTTTYIPIFGMVRIDGNIVHQGTASTPSRNVAYYTDSGTGYQAAWYENGTNQKTVSISGLNGSPSGTVWMFAYDSNSGNWWVGKNGTWGGGDGTLTGSPSNGGNPVITIPTDAIMAPYLDHAGTSSAFRYNFGQRPFSYTPPTGFKSLCTTNLPNPVIKKPSDHFDVKTWTGNGNAITVGNTAKQPTNYQISRSLRFRKANSAYLSAYPTTTGSQTTWTWSGWVKQTLFGTSGTQWLLTSGNSGAIATNYTMLAFSTQGFAGNTNELQFYSTLSNATVFALASNARFESNTGWYHVVAVIDTTQTVPSERIKLYVNGVRITQWSSTSFPSQNTTIPFINSPSFETRIGGIVTYGNYDGYMTEINFVDGQALTPASFGQFDANNNWVPTRYTGTYGTTGYYLPFNDNSSLNSLGIDKSSTAAELITNGNFPANVSGWTVGPGVGGSPSITWVNGAARISNSQNNGVIYYQAIPTTIGTTYYASCYVSNISIGDSSRFVLLQKADNAAGSSNNVTIASRTQGSGNGPLRGTFTATATTTYILINADVLGTGTQGADFDQISVSEVGYKTNWSLNNFSITAGTTYDSMLDSPTDYDDGSGNIRGNYCIMSSQNRGSLMTVENAGLQVTTSANGSQQAPEVGGTLSVSSGKWYWEVTATQMDGQRGLIGVGDATRGASNYSVNGYENNTGYGISSGSYGYWASNGYKYRGNGTDWYTDNTAYGNTYNNGDVIGVALDLDNGKIWFSKNGVWQASGDPVAGTNPAFTGVSGPKTPYIKAYKDVGVAFIAAANFGQRPFSSTPPTGFKSLNTKNLKDAGSYNLPDNYGNFVNTPDLVWIKNRTSTYNHILQDTVRGTNNYLDITTTALNTGVTTSVQAFLPNGFQVGSIAGANNAANNIVGWTWNRGTTPGFDIVNYSGNGGVQTISHNLGQAPKFIIVKKLSSATNSNWMVQHASLGPTYALNLNNTSAAGTTYWNSTSPTSTTFTVDSNANYNASGDSYIAYLWAEVPGFSKFGSYTGNSSADGPFVYTGFRPKWILVKSSTEINNWWLYDAVRDTINPMNNLLRPDLTNADTTQGYADFVSNGFKVRNTGQNNSGQTYVYAAFAEAPFKYANAR